MTQMTTNYFSNSNGSIPVSAAPGPVLLASNTTHSAKGAHKIRSNEHLFPFNRECGCNMLLSELKLT